MATESLKEYLVKIGFNADKASFSNSVAKVKEINTKILDIKNNSSGMSAAFTKASLSMHAGVMLVVGALVEGNKVIANFLSSMAKEDLAIEKQARKFYAAEKSVRAYQYSLDALGESESDLFYMTDEQYDRFLKMNSLAKSLEAPKEADDTLKKVRDIQFEFSKLNLTFQYLKRWVVYFIGKLSGGTLDRIRNKLAKLNEAFQKNMPKIAEFIAKVANVFIRLGEAAVNVVGFIIDGISHLVSGIDTGSIKILGIITALAIAIISGPIGWITAAIVGVLLLIDDFMTWQRGGKSLIDWGGAGNLFSEKGLFGSLGKSIFSIFEPVLELIKTVLEILKPILEAIAPYIVDALKITVKVLSFIFNIISSLLGALNWALRGFFGLEVSGKTEEETLRDSTVIGENPISNNEWEDTVRNMENVDRYLSGEYEPHWTSTYLPEIGDKVHNEAYNEYQIVLNIYGDTSEGRMLAEEAADLIVQKVNESSGFSG